MQPIVRFRQEITARPFVKWAGGKGQLLDILNKFYPVELKAGAIKTYIEPFVGGGAVLFNVLQNFYIERAFIFDINKELINTYQCIRQEPDKLIELLSVLELRYVSVNDEKRKEMYYEIRDKYNSIPLNGYVDIEKAAHFIFLNRTCFNGLYRVNKSGYFNVPMGSYKNPKICDAENIFLLSSLLQNVEIFCENYEKCASYVDKNTFIYFDPPYRPLNSTSSFTSYTDNGFDDEQQVKLGNFYRELDRTGAKMMLSNSDPKNIDEYDDFFDNLFSGFNIYRVSAKRMINSKSTGRGEISELLVLNY